MTKKKNGSLIIKVLVILFIIYTGLFIANVSGYYEGKIRERVIITEEGMKRFDEIVKNGEEVDINAFLKDEKVDYSNGLTRIGDDFTDKLEGIIYNMSKSIIKFLKTLF